MLNRHAVCTGLLFATLATLAACSGASEGNVSDSNPASGPAASKGDPTKAPAGGSGAPDGSTALVELGSVAAGAPVTFDVPAGTRGFTILTDATITADDSIGVQELTDPSGKKVVGEFLDAAHPDRMVGSIYGTNIAALRVPLVDDDASRPLPAGKWTLRMGGVTRNKSGPKGASTPWSGQLHGAVRLLTTSDGAFHGGTIDLDLYVPDGLTVGGGKNAGHTITATSAATDAEMKTRVDTAFALFKRLYGVERGDVRFHAVAASLLSISGQEGVEAANVAANAQNARPAAQVVLTNVLSPDGDGTEISGISNCLPGAVGVPGTKCSAVIVSLRADSPAWQDAATMVHELGHFVGLNHTTELDGEGDTLADTPVCVISGKASLDNCVDKENLMFPSVNLATNDTTIVVSEMQRALFRTSPIYRATR